MVVVECVVGVLGLLRVVAMSRGEDRRLREQHRPKGSRRAGLYVFQQVEEREMDAG